MIYSNDRKRCLSGWLHHNSRAAYNTALKLQIDSHYFVFHKNDCSRLTEQHFDILSSLAESNQLLNPVFVDMDEGGAAVN